MLYALALLGASLVPAAGLSAADARAAALSAAQPAVGRELHPDLLKKTIEKYLEGEWGQRVTAVQVTVLEPSESKRMPPGVIELRVLHSGDEGLGRRLFRVAATADGKPWTIIETLTDVAATVDVVATARALKIDELIEAADLTTARTRVYDLKHPYITDAAEVVGKSAARPLQPDTPLRPAFLKKPFMVKKGDRVMIEARRGGLSIQTSGITKASGHVGESIMVANVDSGRELRARIVAPGLVQVEF